MKVGFDVSLDAGHLSRGVGFYSKNLLHALKKIKQLEIVEITNLKNIKQVDLVHIPFFDFYSRSLPNLKLPTVVTVHDVVPLIFKKHYPSGIKVRLNLYFQKKSFAEMCSYYCF